MRRLAFRLSDDRQTTVCNAHTKHTRGERVYLTPSDLHIPLSRHPFALHHRSVPLEHTILHVHTYTETTQLPMLPVILSAPVTLSTYDASSSSTQGWLCIVSPICLYLLFWRSFGVLLMLCNFLYFRGGENIRNGNLASDFVIFLVFFRVFWIEFRELCSSLLTKIIKS